MTELEQSAFVTGGSGFIGGRLIQRLVADGWTVRALARSDQAAARVEALGAEAVHGDLDSGAALRAGAHGCAYAFHAAAHLGASGDWKAFEHVNVDGTRNALAACRDAEVRRFVHVGTEAALMAGEPLIEVDERAPLRPDSKSPYSATQVRAGRFAWIGGGRHRTSTTHVDNVVEGLLAGARRGRPGNAYFVLDDGGA